MCFLASVPFAVAATAIAWPSPTLPKLLSGDAPVSLNLNEASWMVSLLYLGNFTSPIPAGYFANRFGPRTTLLYSGLIPIISWLLILFTTEPIVLFIARFLIGFQFGIVSTIQPLYIGEISQPDIRGTLSTLNNFAFNAGSLFTFVIGPYVSYYTLIVVSLILPLIFVSSFPYMPESPYYSMMTGEMNQARESLFWLRGDLNRIELELELDQIEKVVDTQMKKQGSFKDVFSTEASRKAITISIVLSAVKRLSGAGVIQAFATVTLPQITFGVLNPNDCVLILGIVTILASFVATLIADKFGRKTLLVISCLGCSISMFAVSIWFFLKTNIGLNMSQSTFVPFIAYLCQTLSYNLACGPSGATTKGEMFPGNVKTKSSALATMTLGATSFLLNIFYLEVALWPGMYFNYLVFAVSCFLAIFFVIFYMPETRGKTLQEIQDILGGTQRSNTRTNVPRTF